VRLLSADAAFRGITLKTDLQPRLPTVLVHTVQFQQVIIDLVVKVFEIVSEAAPPNIRRVIIKSSVRGGRELLVSVVAQNVLSRFSNRLHAYSASPRLFISSLIVEAHHGTLRMKPAAPGDVVFEFSTPLIQV
jgi:hypothetical protein